MDHNTKVTYAVILLGIVLLLLPIMMTIAYIISQRKIKGKNNIDKKRALKYAFSSHKLFLSYSEDEKNLGIIYYCRFCFVLLPILIIVLIFVFSSLETY